MRLRQGAVRGIAVSAVAAALVVGLAGCVGGTSDAPAGPNGYDLGATVGDDVRAWVDVSETTSAVDVILERAGESQPLGVCLGGGATVCVLGDVAVQPFVVFVGPPGAERVATLTWNGTPMEMTRLEHVPGDVNQVYVAAPAAADPAALAYSFSVAEPNGEVVYTQ